MLRYSRYRDGNTEIKFEPPLTRKTAPADTVLELTKDPELQGRLEGRLETEDLQKVADLAGSRREWNEQAGKDVQALIRWLELPITETPEDGKDTETVEQPTPEADMIAAQQLKDWQQQMSEPEPAAVAGVAIAARIPKFLLFSEQDRTLRFEYSLSRRSTKQNGKQTHTPSEDVLKPDGGLVNLLKLGNTNIREFYALVHDGVPERTSGQVRKVNRALKEAISPHWGQRNLEVRVDVSDTTLRVFIDDGEDTARFTDRSDGLRIFVALISFLAQHSSDPSPILLIDEADTHLHYNAQADLINFLLELPSRTIYSTHSPGCLPLDLGTGIRVVKPHPDRATSVLSNSFWENDQPGLTPLLFAMGAGAAAFTALRAAVFTEGASDMMLLPTLIRRATNQHTLGYQVVPGLANIHPDQLDRTDYAAVRVAYLLDGDDGGDEHQAALERAHVPRDRIRRLPAGLATEDLIEPDFYLHTVNAVLTDSQRVEQVTREDVQADLENGVTIAKSVENALGGHRRTPSKVAVAGRLLRHDGPIPMTDQARECLKAHHATFLELLSIEG
ncbi:ATP-dependent nuclease [Nesterenkonia muleiensis]|uniref:ATP-dependent nuclease n=1 Tax=Nesterenkonia muleiensis TaxID=2282648 RepID=UPI00308282DE